jgi:16S rRNA (cytosine967-C5)-methyltransferase
VIEIQRNASLTLLAVLHGRSLTPALDDIRLRSPRLKPNERAAIQDLAFGGCRWLGTLRAVLAQLLRAPLTDEEVEALLLVALYQLQWTRAAQHAVVDGAVRTCVALGKPSAKGLVNGVLRNFLRQREALLERARTTEVGRFSYPQWWIDEAKAAWPAQYAEILDAGNLHPPMTLRVNRRRTDIRSYRAALADAGIEAEPVGPAGLRLAKPVPVQALPDFQQGVVSVQDLAAQYAAPLLDLTAGQRVLDACAAPGGKSAHILELCDVELLALDRDAERLERVRGNLDRLGLKAQLQAADAADAHGWWDGRHFDRILLDAPCTGSGVVRRHPDGKWLRRRGDIAQLAAEQSRLLQGLWHTLGPDGKLLYVTCSVFPAETESRIAAFMASHDDASRLALPGLPAGGQLLPDTRHDGFFYGLLQKRPAPAD